MCVRALEHVDGESKGDADANNSTIEGDKGHGKGEAKEGRVCREDLVLALSAVLELLDTPGASDAESAVLEAQGGDTFRDASAYTAHLFDSLGAREDATELSSSAYTAGAWQSLDVFLATRLSPLNDIED